LNGDGNVWKAQHWLLLSSIMAPPLPIGSCETLKIDTKIEINQKTMHNQIKNGCLAFKNKEV
jgi:hypothetical protein